MEWKQITQESWNTFDHSLSLDKAILAKNLEINATTGTFHIFAIAFEKSPSCTYAISPSRDEYIKSTQNKIALLVFNEEEINQSSTWSIILQAHPTGAYTLSYYWENILKHTLLKIKMETLVRAYLHYNESQEINHQLSKQWEEASSFDQYTLELYQRHALPIAVLRLFNRLSIEDKVFWLALWKRQNISKNYVVQNIHDIDLLNSHKKKEAIELTQGLEHSLEQKKQKNFPIQLRDLIQSLAYPHRSKLLKEIYQKKQKLFPTSSAKIDLYIPPDLESIRHKLLVDFRNINELKESLIILQDEEKLAKIQEILDLLEQ